jgi:hypothetical protein
LVATIGVGSIAFHGPMPPWSEFFHDISIVLALVWLLLVETRRTHWWPLGLALAAAASITPVIADPVQAALAAAVIVCVAVPRRRRVLRLQAVSILAVGGLVGTLSRTGWPLCNPDSIWQGHGFWHLAAAAALAVWGSAIRPSG